MKNEVAQTDKDLEQKASILQKDEKALKEVLKACEHAFGEITGEVPDKAPQSWKWFLMKTYNDFLILKMQEEYK